MKKHYVRKKGIYARMSTTFQYEREEKMQALKSVETILIITIIVFLISLKTANAEEDHLITNPYGVYWKGNGAPINSNAIGDIHKLKLLHDNDEKNQFSFMFKIPPEYINHYSNSPDIWIKLLRAAVKHPDCKPKLIPIFIKIARDKWEKVEKFGLDTSEYDDSSAAPIKLVGSKPSSFEIFRIDGNKLKLRPHDEIVLGFLPQRTGRKDGCDEKLEVQDIQVKWGYGRELFKVKNQPE